MEEKLIGKVSHCYNRLSVAIIDLSGDLSVGQTVRFKGGSDDFTQEISEMQYERENIQQAKKGQSVGVKVNQKVHEHDQVFLAV